MHWRHSRDRWYDSRIASYGAFYRWHRQTIPVCPKSGYSRLPILWVMALRRTWSGPSGCVKLILVRVWKSQIWNLRFEIQWNRGQTFKMVRFHKRLGHVASLGTSFIIHNLISRASVRAPLQRVSNNSTTPSKGQDLQDEKDWLSWEIWAFLFRISKV